MSATADADPIPRRTLLPFGAARDLLAVFPIGASTYSARCVYNQPYRPPSNLASLGTCYAASAASAASFGLGTCFNGLVAIIILASLMAPVLLAATASQWP